MKTFSVMLASLLIVVMNLVLVGCVRASSHNREAYILAHRYGWIEISVQDRNIPAAKAVEAKPGLVGRLKRLFSTSQESPPASAGKAPAKCTLIVRLNNEGMLDEYVYPYGDRPPYRAETGFRFPAPVGSAELSIAYSGCDDVNEASGEAVATSSLTVTVTEGMVIPIAFDGERLSAGEPYPNKMATLEEIREQLKDIEKKLPARP